MSDSFLFDKMIHILCKLGQIIWCNTIIECITRCTWYFVRILSFLFNLEKLHRMFRYFSRANYMGRICQASLSPKSPHILVNINDALISIIIKMDFMERICKSNYYDRHPGYLFLTHLVRTESYRVQGKKKMLKVITTIN